MKLESPMSTSAALRALERPTVTRVWRIKNSVWSSLTNRANAVPFVVAPAEDRRVDCGWLAAFGANASGESFRVEFMMISKQTSSQVRRQRRLFLLLLLSQCQHQQRKWRPTGVFTWPRAHGKSREITKRNVTNKMLSYRRDRAAGRVTVFAKSRRLELGDNIIRTFNHCDNRPENLSNSVKKRKIRAITAFKVIQGHRRRYQSKARMWLFIGD